MPDAVADTLAARFGIAYHEGYGMTETASFLHANPLHRGKRGSLGVPGPGVDSRIVDPETLQPLAQGEVGEIVTHGAAGDEGLRTGRAVAPAGAAPGPPPARPHSAAGRGAGRRRAR